MIDLSAFGDLSTIDVGAFSPKPTTLTPGQTEAAVNLWASEDEKTNIGVWECTPGEFTADRTASAEYCHILSGSVTVIGDNGGAQQSVGAGGLLILPMGWTGKWIVHEHVRKTYIIVAR